MVFRFLSITLLFLCNLSFGVENLTVTKMSGSITFDGICSSEEWDQYETIPLCMFQPYHDQETSERSDVFVAYDASYFYVSARLYYENGAILSSVSKKRDSFDEGNDMLGITFDSFNDNENGMGFVTAPSGLRMDFNVFNDALGSTRKMPFSHKIIRFIVSIQYNGVDHVGIDNIRIRYNPREGNDLWLAYNDVMNTNRNREFPNLPQTDSRTFIIKYNHTFRWAK